LQFASTSSDVFVAEVFNFLSCGATLVFGLDRKDLTVAAFMRFIAERRITITGMPSTWWTEVVTALADGTVRLPSSLRAVIAGMERVDPAILETWKRVTDGRVRWFNAYGPSETTGTATIYESGTSDWEDRSIVPIGRPLPNVSVYVLDEQGTRLAPGMLGELYIGGAGVALGYFDEPDLSAERFLTDPFRREPGARMYRTGDLVFWLPDGNLVFVGRTDHQVKIRGHRVELEEIEHALAQHPAIHLCAVVLHRRQQLVAYVTTGGPAPGRDELVAHLDRRLPRHMLPARFVVLPELPRTAAGKIDRVALSERELPAEAAPVGRAPSTVTERRLAALWGDVLGVREPAATDDFFELGGDSLQAARLLAAVHADFGVDMDLAALRDAPTIAQLAHVLDEGPPSPKPRRDSAAAIHRTLSAVIASGGIPLAARSSLVTVLNENGTEPPLIWCFNSPQHEMSALGRSLGADRPLYGMYSGSMQLPFTDEISDGVADEYERELLALFPAGPLILGGNCRGADVALRLALRFLASSRPVSHLCLMEYFHSSLYDYAGRLLLLYGCESDERAYLAFNWGQAGWERRFRRVPDVHWIPGAHGHFFDIENVGGLVGRLRTFLQDAASTIA